MDEGVKEQRGRSVAARRAAGRHAPDPKRPDRRARERERRRDIVFSAAIALFVERGFDQTTMDEIAARADVARASVFNYFERKTAILDEWSARRRSAAFAAVRADDVSPRRVDDVLTHYLLEIARISTQSRGETIAIMGAAVHATNVLDRPPLADELTRFLVRARDAGELRDGVDPALAGLMLAASYFAVLTRWIADDSEPFDLGDELLSALAVLLPGIVPTPRRADVGTDEPSQHVPDA